MYQLEFFLLEKRKRNTFKRIVIKYNKQPTERDIEEEVNKLAINYTNINRFQVDLFLYLGKNTENGKDKFKFVKNIFYVRDNKNKDKLKVKKRIN